MKKRRRDEAQHYDYWLHWSITKKCNLDCEYCFSHINEGIKANAIDTESLQSALAEHPGTFRISFTGGEPFIVPNFIEACLAITAKHYLSLNTNLVSKQVKEFAETISPERVLHIHASLHLRELERKGLLNKFFENFILLREKGFNIYAEAVAFPPYLSEIERYKALANSYGIDYNYAPFIGEVNGKKYPASYSDNEITQFGLKNSHEDEFAQKGELCNAGFNAVVVFSNGNVFPCFNLKNKLGNIYEGFSFEPNIRKCPAKRCGCPLNIYDDYLFEKGKRLSVKS